MDDNPVIYKTTGKRQCRPCKRRRDKIRYERIRREMRDQKMISAYLEKDPNAALVVAMADDRCMYNHDLKSFPYLKCYDDGSIDLRIWHAYFPDDKLALLVDRGRVVDDITKYLYLAENQGM